MQSVWGPDGPEIDDAVAPKRQRLFIARQPQACEMCRQKKTRCDGGQPCGLCRAAGVACAYAERKATKNEVSLGMIFNTLQRIEAKIEEQQQRDDRGHADADAAEIASRRSGLSRAPTEARDSRESREPRESTESSQRQQTPRGQKHDRDDASPVSAVGAYGYGGPMGDASGIDALLSAAHPLSPQLQTPSQAQAQMQAQTQAQPQAPRMRHVPVIQYPIRQIANWPAIRAVLQTRGHVVPLPDSVGDGGTPYPYLYDAAAATLLEQRRAPLPVPSMGGGGSGSRRGLGGGDDEWLTRLSITLVKGLSDAFFATFNLANPVLDRRLFRQHSLGVAVESGFGVNMESCLVLVTMALGVLGQRALRAAGIDDVGGDAGGDKGVDEGDDDGHRGSNAAAAAVDDGDVWDGGLVFFHEARKRIGLLDGDSSLQACQFHLLCGLFYAQLVRPLDWWSHVSRAGACCTRFWACVPTDCDEWTMDMQARLFWITAMFEALITQELDVPASNLASYEDRVPLPKFVAFPGVSSVDSGGLAASTLSSYAAGSVAAAADTAAEQDAFCHYHFLSQIAHRIILTRLCDSLFAHRGRALASGLSIAAAAQATTHVRADYPPQALEDELLHQLEQWRSQLPGYLQWDEGEGNAVGNAVNDADANGDAHGSTVDTVDPANPADPANPINTANTARSTRTPPPSPVNVFVVPWLQARYCIASYHLRRPLLHRALHHPDWMTPADLDKCRDALGRAVRWCDIIRPTLAAPDCLHLTFFICTQLFGLLLLFHALARSPRPALRGLVPPTYAAWRAFALDVLGRVAPRSPAVARELALVLSLGEPPAAAMRGAVDDVDDDDGGVGGAHVDGRDKG